jgi:hypothetical protein
VVDDEPGDGDYSGGKATDVRARDFLRNRGLKAPLPLPFRVVEAEGELL